MLLIRKKKRQKRKHEKSPAVLADQTDFLRFGVVSLGQKVTFLAERNDTKQSAFVGYNPPGMLISYMQFAFFPSVDCGLELSFLFSDVYRHL